MRPGRLINPVESRWSSVRARPGAVSLSTEPIGHRRQAGRDVSRLFGNRGCAVHSPTALRPGAIADDIRQDLEDCGYGLQTAADQPGHGGLIEVYPHVALLALLESRYRVPYKVSRSLQCWRTEQLSGEVRRSGAQPLPSPRSGPRFRPMPVPHQPDPPAMAARQALHDRRFRLARELRAPHQGGGDRQRP